MKQRTFRLRRAAVTLTLGVGVIGGVVGASSGIAAAGAAVNSALGSGSSITSTANPPLNGSTADQAAGNLIVTLGAGTYVNTGDEIQLTVAAVGGGTIDWSVAPTVTAGGSGDEATAGAVTGAGSAVLDIPLTANAGQNPSTALQTFTLSGVEFSTTGASGAVQVGAQYLGQTTSSTTPGAYSASIGSVQDGVIPPAASTFALTALSTPSVGAGQNSQTAGGWQVSLSGAVGTAWTSGDEYVIGVNDTSATNCVGSDYVYFASTPTATVTSVTGLSTTPTFTTSLGDSGATCGGTEPNALILTFTNSGTITNATGVAGAITISGVSYDVGSGTPSGNVSVSAAYGTSGSLVTTTAASTTGSSFGGPSNASVGPVTITANNPAVTVPAGGLNAAISSIAVSEASAGKVPSGYVCVTLAEGSFSTATTPTAAASGGNGTAASTVTLTSVDTAGTGSNATTNDTAAFDVTAASTGTTGSTYTLSGLSVDAPTGTSGAVLAYVTTGAASPATCGTTGTIVNTAGTTAYTVSTASNVIAGSDADGTAVAELENAYSVSTCPTSHAVVLATDSNYPDALAGAYLARYLGTGELLTPTGSLSAETLQAIRQEGIEYVFVVGGPLAVSQADISQLEGTQAYDCGGTAGLTQVNEPQDLQVTQIYGQTMYDTAQDIAQYVPATFVNSDHSGGFSFVGASGSAFSGTNTSGGTGMFNDTSGTASTAPSVTTSLRTAILATGQGWQDAESASVLSYAEDMPILLTSPSSLSTQAQAAISALGIQQVIVMGGPLAISNAVVTSLQGLGVSVLRIAGQDYTDTSTQLANFEVEPTTLGGLGWDPEGRITVARGDFYSDGLAGAVDAATGGVANADPSNTTGVVCTVTEASTVACATPLILTLNPSSIGTYLPSWLAQAGSSVGIDKNAGTLAGDQIGSLVVLGGPEAVTPTEISQIETDL